ncbi:Hypothetical predicted protein [Cloeon dipterum]|uniref:Uncharacterized protein n=1 Tax=Cloeon dipterum TaxID=197152 RepID=A0A8S1DUL6_9INSE|nr:Hypothetical predicted protein [Cloeon dipterum]
MMIDVEYYAITEKKLFSLQEIAFDTVVKNLVHYKELIRSKVSPPFRKELYEEARNSVWKKTYEERFGLWTMLPYLEPHKTAESIDLREFKWAMPKLEANPKYWHGCDFDDDEYFDAPLDEILSYLGQRAPNLQEIRIHDPRPYVFQSGPKKPLLDSSSIDLIVKMKNLTRISIHSVQINLTGFLHICREFQNVQEIEAENILLDVPKSDLRAILEKINTVFDHQEYVECTFPTIFGIIFKKTDSVEIYREARVILDDSIFVDSLPELTHLRTYCGEEYQRHMKNFQHILSKVGGSLKKLTLTNFSQKSKLTFKNIFEHCESLEFLDLRSSYIADANEPLNSFGKLKEFDWCYADQDHALTLNSILCAPLLEKIDLISYKFDLGDKEALFNQIRRGEICTNLKMILFEFETEKESENEEVRSTSLVKLAFKVVVMNLGRYKELLKAKIPLKIRRELYEGAIHRFRSDLKRYELWEALPYLEPHNTDEFFQLHQFSWIEPKFELKPGQSDSERDYKVSLDEVLCYLAQHVPNLKQLFIDDERYDDDKEIFKKPRLGPGSIDLLVQMKNLTKISINEVNVELSGFVRICREFENLQEIDAQRILVDVDPKSDVKAILETFPAFDHQEYNERTFPRKFGILFKKTDSAENYRVARVELDSSPDSIFLDTIPEITHMQIDGSNKSEDHQSHVKNLEHILKKVGGYLKNLTLNSFCPKSKITFKHIFEHCKSLESLELRHSFVADDDEPIGSFGKLKEIRWNNSLSDHAITLKSILSAPLLKKIDLIADIFDLSDKEALLNRIRNGEICANVDDFVVEDRTYQDNAVWNGFYELFDAIRTTFPKPMTTRLEKRNIQHIGTAELFMKQWDFN